tara:strand:+ start:7258 stop:7437 length:180 start_codon:yes stop_codon:yes gene_type:complete
MIVVETPFITSFFRGFTEIISIYKKQIPTHTREFKKENVFIYENLLDLIKDIKKEVTID